MGSSRSKPLPKPPKIEEAPSVIEEADLTAQSDYLKQQAKNRMSVANTVMTNPIKPKQTMMASASKKRKKARLVDNDDRRLRSAIFASIL